MTPRCGGRTTGCEFNGQYLNDLASGTGYQLVARTDLTLNATFNHVALQDEAAKWKVAVNDLQIRNVAGQEPKVKIVETALDRVPRHLCARF